MQGKSRWMGSGQPLFFRYCQAISTLIRSEPKSGYYSRRAGEEMATLCEEFNWLSERLYDPGRGQVRQPHILVDIRWSEGERNARTRTSPEVWNFSRR